MAEYIDREEAIRVLSKPITMSMCVQIDECKFKRQQRETDLELIKSFPATDVQPVEWIPVTERLPEKKGNYLVVFDCGHGVEVHEAFFFKYFDSWGWYDPVEEYQQYNPTHWMPLPKPPKDGET